MGIGVTTSVIREAVKSYVVKRWCTPRGIYHTLQFHGGDKVPEERLVGFQVFGFLCGVHMVVLRCGTDPLTPEIFHLVGDGINDAPVGINCEFK